MFARKQCVIAECAWIEDFGKGLSQFKIIPLILQKDSVDKHQVKETEIEIGTEREMNEEWSGYPFVDHRPKVRVRVHHPRPRKHGVQRRQVARERASDVFVLDFDGHLPPRIPRPVRRTVRHLLVDRPRKPSAHDARSIRKNRW